MAKLRVDKIASVGVSTEIPQGQYFLMGMQTTLNLQIAQILIMEVVTFQ